MPQLSRFDGGSGGITIDLVHVFESFTPTGPSAVSAITVFMRLMSWRGVVVLKATFLRKISFKRSTGTLLALSTSAVIGIVWPHTKPVAGNKTTAVRGPDAQQKQQNVFSSSTFAGSCNGSHQSNPWESCKARRLYYDFRYIRVVWHKPSSAD